MGVARRLASLFRLKSGRADAEDPRAVLDDSYRKQAELLAQVRRGVADVATSRRRLELQATQLQGSADKLHAQAQEALAGGKEDVAREALTRRQAALTQLADLQLQRDGLAREEDRLTLAAERLQAKVEAFRSRKDAIKASYTAAEAQTRIGEALTGMSDEMGDVSLAIQRAEDKTMQMQSRASAIDELLASGVLEDASAPGGPDRAQAALDRQAATVSVDTELARLKGQLGAAPEAKAIGANDSASTESGGNESRGNNSGAQEASQ
jgi:phage shock protein A